MANNLAFKVKEIRELRVNDIVLHPVYRPDGLLFVKKYKKLTESIINHIKKHFPPNYPFLVAESEEQLQQFMHDRQDEQQEFYEQLKKIVAVHQKYTHIPLSLELYDERLAKRKKDEEDEHELAFLNQIHPNVLMPMWSIFEQIFDSPRLLNRIKQLNGQLNDLVSKDETILALFNRMYHYHDALVVHSLNTMCISLMVGLALELSDEELMDLTLAALFADIGFTELPKDDFVHYLNSGKMNHELTKEHLRLSVEVIATASYCRRKSIVYGILDHHEEYQGTGLPNHKAKENIHLFGRIIAIAKLYDELVGGYIKEESRLSFDAIEEVWKQSGVKIDPTIFRIFLEKSRIYKVGELIRLPNNEIATVIGFRDYLRYPLHPIVRKRNGEWYDCSIRL